MRPRSTQPSPRVAAENHLVWHPMASGHLGVTGMSTDPNFVHAGCDRMPLSGPLRNTTGRNLHRCGHCGTRRHIHGCSADESQWSRAVNIGSHGIHLHNIAQCAVGVIRDRNTNVDAVSDVT